MNFYDWLVGREREMLAAMAGGFTSLPFLRLPAYMAVIAIICSVLVAAFLGPWVEDKFGFTTPEGRNAFGFLTGLLAFSILVMVFQLIERLKQDPVKTFKEVFQAWRGGK